MRAKQQVAAKASSDSLACAGLKTVMLRAAQRTQQWGSKKTRITSVIALKFRAIFIGRLRFYKI
jgi:hypothetical protein